MDSTNDCNTNVDPAFIAGGIVMKYADRLSQRARQALASDIRRAVIDAQQRESYTTNAPFIELLERIRAALESPSGYPMTQRAAELLAACKSDAAALERIVQHANEALNGEADVTAMLSLIVDLASYSACANALKRMEAAE